MSWRCWLFGHKRTVEDLGGIIYEVCDRCPWVGRSDEYHIFVNCRSDRLLLADYAILMNKHGAESEEARRLLDAYRDNLEFVELADLSRKLKVALTARRMQ